MTLFEITALLMVLTALFSFINYRVLRMPTTIGVMLIALAVSLGIVTLGWIGVDIGQSNFARILNVVDFDQTLLHGLLSFLLFAGALQIKLEDLANHKWAITILATAGVVASTFIVGGLTWLVLDFLSIPVSFIYCLLFGALISPTARWRSSAFSRLRESPKTWKPRLPENHFSTTASAWWSF